MKGRLLWLFWIGIIGITWNLILIGYGLWEQHKLKAHVEPAETPVSTQRHYDNLLCESIVQFLCKQG